MQIYNIPDSLFSIRLLEWPSEDVITWLGDQVMWKSALKFPVETTDANTELIMIANKEVRRRKSLLLLYG